MTPLSINERKTYIKKYLCGVFPKVIADITSEYDYEFKGISYILGNQTGYVDFLGILSDCSSYSIVSCYGITGTFTRTITMKIWNPKTKKCDTSLLCHPVSLWNYGNLEILPDERMITTFNETLKIWNPKIQKEEYDMTLIGHSDRIYSIASFHDHTCCRIVSASHDKTLKIWNIKKNTYECELTLVGHTSGVCCVATLKYGGIISGDYYGNLKIWNKDTGICELTIKAHNACVHNILILSDDEIKFRVACCSNKDSTIKLWNFQIINQKPIILNDTVTLKNPGEVQCIARMPDGRIMSSCYSELQIKYMVCVWNPASEACDLTIAVLSKIISIKTLPDGQIVTSSDDGSIEIWN